MIKINMTKMSLVVVAMVTGLLGGVTFLPVQTALVTAQGQTNLTFEVVLSKSEYIKMEPVPFEFKVVNKSAEPVNWSALVAIGPSTNLFVKNENGFETKWEGRKLLTILLATSPMRLDPGREYTNTTFLQMGTVERVFPKAGKYEVRFELLYNKYTPDLQRETIMSNPVAITIVEPKGADLQAYSFLNEEIKPAQALSKDDETLRLKQTFVDRFPDSAYTRYLVFELASVYQALGQDQKAVRELCKLSNENFYFSDRVQRQLLEIDEKLHPTVMTPLSENDPIPSKPNPCLR
ncbi:MAG: hypothetical protein ACRD6X_01775 [Pyrinomonadaceae bacterium]